jgi:hypothetical protein
MKNNTARNILKRAKKSSLNSNRHTNCINFNFNFDLEFAKIKVRTNAQNSNYSNPLIQILVKKLMKQIASNSIVKNYICLNLTAQKLTKNETTGKINIHLRSDYV